MHKQNRPGFEVALDNQVEDHYQVNGQQTLKHLALFVKPVCILYDSEVCMSRACTNYAVHCIPVGQHPTMTSSNHPRHQAKR